MSKFKENTASVCRAVGRVAMPLLAIASTMYAGAEAAELLDISQAVGAYVGFMLASAGWLGIAGKNAPTEKELFGCDLDSIVDGREAIIGMANEHPGAFEHVDVPTKDSSGFITYGIPKN